MVRNVNGDVLLRRCRVLFLKRRLILAFVSSTATTLRHLQHYTISKRLTRAYGAVGLLKRYKYTDLPLDNK